MRRVLKIWPVFQTQCDDEVMAEDMIYEDGVEGPEIIYDGPHGEIINNTRRKHDNATKTQNTAHVKRVQRRIDDRKKYEVEIMREDGLEEGEPLAIEGGEDTPGICQVRTIILNNFISYINSLISYRQEGIVGKFLSITSRRLF